MLYSYTRVHNSGSQTMIQNIEHCSLRSIGEDGVFSLHKQTMKANVLPVILLPTIYINLCRCSPY